MLSYRFSNLLGSAYKGGTIRFTPDGNAVLAPVGNRVGVIDLVSNRSLTLEPEAVHTVKVMAINPAATLLFLFDDSGHCCIVNFARNNVLSRFRCKERVYCAQFSPDGAYIAVGMGKILQIWAAPTVESEWVAARRLHWASHLDTITDLQWSPCCQFIVTSGSDCQVRVHPTDAEGQEGFAPAVLSTHKAAVRGAFFDGGATRVFSIDGRSVLLTWEWKADGGVVADPPWSVPGAWERTGFYQVKEGHGRLTKAAYSVKSRIAAFGFSSGVFAIYLMPGVEALHKLSIGADPIDSIAITPSGDWICAGAADSGQIAVWEWQSETYVLKQQGHHAGVNAVCFSPAGGALGAQGSKALTTSDGQQASAGGAGGQLMCTGGQDGKVKLWNTLSGFCFVTFADHSAPVSAVEFTPQANAVVSASLDGTVRAFDLLRYRNFRTFVGPDSAVQFGSVAVDPGGEIVAAGGRGSTFSVFIWSMQTGKLLDVLVGHESSPTSLAFNPHPSKPGQLVTAALDGVLKVWDVFSRTGNMETLHSSAAVLSVAFDPRGTHDLAASTLAGQVYIWNTESSAIVNSIDGLRDIQSGRHFKGKTSTTNKKGLAKGHNLGPNSGVNQNQHFSSVTYTATGHFLVCSSRNSPHICLYTTSGFLLAHKLVLTRNRSLTGVSMLVPFREITELGVHKKEIDASDSEMDAFDECADIRRRNVQKNRLPGVVAGDAAEAYSEEELHVFDVACSMDGRSISAASSQGVFVFAADSGGQGVGQLYGTALERFMPRVLTKNVTVPAILACAREGRHAKAMILALALNNYDVLLRVQRSVPLGEIAGVVRAVAAPLLPGLLQFLAAGLHPATGSGEVGRHVRWLVQILEHHVGTINDMCNGTVVSTPESALSSLSSASKSLDLRTVFLHLLSQLQEHHKVLGAMFTRNIYTLKYVGRSGCPPQQEALEAEPAAAEEETAEKPAKKRRTDAIAAVEAVEEVVGKKATTKKKKKKRQSG